MVKELKVIFVLEIPAPYRDALLELMSKQDKVRLKVFYLNDKQIDRHWINIKRDYAHEVLKSKKFIFKGDNFFTYLINFDILSRIKNESFNLIILGGYVQLPMQLIAIYCQRKKIPYLIHTETHGLRKRSLFKKLIRDFILFPTIVRKAAGFLCGTSKAKEYLIEHGIKKEKTHLFPNSCDVDRFYNLSLEFKKNRGQIRKDLGISQQFVVLTIGRLVGVKRFDAVITAVSKIINDRKISDIALLIVGEGPEKEKLEKLAQDAGIQEKVFFLKGRSISEMVKFYAIADVFVLASEDEPAGVVVSEAMSCELPCILSDRVGAAYDLLEDGKNGYMFPVGNIDSLVQKIVFLYGDSSERQRMGQYAYVKAKQFDFNFALSQWNKIIAE